MGVTEGDLSIGVDVILGNCTKPFVASFIGRLTCVVKVRPLPLSL